MVGFIGRMREERKFKSREELVAQLRKDAETVAELFGRDSEIHI